MLGSQGFFRWLCVGSHGPAPGPVDIHLFYASSQRHAAGNQAAVRPRLQSGTWAAAAAVVAVAWIYCPTPGKPEPGVRASPFSHTGGTWQKTHRQLHQGKVGGSGAPKPGERLLCERGRLFSDLHLLGSYICVLGRSAHYYLATVQTWARRLCYPNPASNGVSWSLI